MAMIDVVKWDDPGNAIAWRFPSSNLKLGTQLIVKPGQVAFFVYKGRICDEVTEGHATLNSGNIPILGSLLNLPFGGETPFQAEVWFINRLANFDSKWGTSSPVQIEDPRYGVILPVRAFGQFAFRISDARTFLEIVLGTAPEMIDHQIGQFFRGKIVSTAVTQIGSMLNEQISFVNMSAHLDYLSQEARKKVDEEMRKYGVSLDSFFFESINVPEDDPSYIKLRQIKEKSAELNVIGRDIYQLDKSMEVLNSAAQNEGLSSVLMQSGLGAGMGLMMGAQIGQQAGSMATQLASSSPLTPPPIANSNGQQYFAVINDSQLGPVTIEVLSQMAKGDLLKAGTLVWREGYSAWIAASTVPELSRFFGNTPEKPQEPPPLPPGL